ncbi:MAG TPA: DegT/DnrJ/EryC1/StrS family aminotransferase [Actinomycetes bacterium]|nr:DegT/DnrJ/EryC1/StrS family aminotransferase [Actinomycetes bacterium]
MPNDAAEGADGRARQVPFARVEICEEARQAAARVLESGWVTTGPEVLAFERELAEWVGAGNGVAVASCTAAIELALRALGLPRGAKVLTSTMTFCGAVHAIVHAGLVPVLADVDPVTLCSDAPACEAAARRAGGVDAMVVTHYAGYPAPVAELAEAAGLPLERVVEDAAHALGTWIGTRPVGTVSAATCFSFYATKNLPIGEGGMVTTDDPAIADHLRRGRLHGMSNDAWRRYLPGSAWRYSVEVAGLKANMTDLQAAIGRAQLRRFAGWQERRALLADRYEQGLAGVPGVLPPARPASGRHAWHLYAVQIGPELGLGRDELIARLAEHGVSCSVHFIPVHHFPYFRRLLGPDLAGRHPGADAAFERIVSLPLYPGLGPDDVDHVCELIAGLRGRGGSRRGQVEAVRR